MDVLKTSHEWCLGNKDVLGWSQDQVDRMKELSHLIYSAHQARTACESIISSGTATIIAELKDSKLNLQRERTLKLQAEMRLKLVINQADSIRKRNRELELELNTIKTKLSIERCKAENLTKHVASLSR